MPDKKNRDAWLFILLPFIAGAALFIGAWLAGLVVDIWPLLFTL